MESAASHRKPRHRRFQQRIISIWDQHSIDCLPSPYSHEV